MLKIIKDKVNSMEKVITQIMRYGIGVSAILSLIATLVLISYQYTHISPDLYYIGILLFKTALFLMTDFIMCGFAIDTIKKQMI